MPQAIQQLNVQEIVKAVLTHYQGDVEKIILFGLQARGEADEFSDIDLIIIRNTGERFVARLGNAPNLPIHADIFVYTPEEFENMKEHENPFILSALESSKVLYSKKRKK